MAEAFADRAAVDAALAQCIEPETGSDIVSNRQVREVLDDNGALRVQVALTSHDAPLWADKRAEIEQLLRENMPGVKDVEVEIVEHDRPPTPRGEMELKVKSVIAVGSGKGGVGKSTMAASIAYGLKRAGATVGLLDADVYGPSIPHLLGVDERPELINNRIQPILRDEIKVMSIGLLVPPEEAMIWRGPMLHGTISRFLADTDWGELDYLIIDMPPGTGDVALSLSQLLPLSGAVIVCTPQDVALMDAVRAVTMFEKVHIPVLGVIENMSGFVCPDNGKRYDIFGSGGAKDRATKMEIPFLGEVPINIQVRVHGDEGTIKGVYEDEITSVPLTEICRRLVENLRSEDSDATSLPSL